MPKSRKPYCIGERYFYAESYKDAKLQASFSKNPLAWIAKRETAGNLDLR